MTLTRFLTAYIYNPLMLWLTRRRLEKGRSGLVRGNATVGRICLSADVSLVADNVPCRSFGMAQVTVLSFGVASRLLSDSQSCMAIGRAEALARSR